MSDQERTFLGLTHNPFARADDRFFNGAERSAHLDRLRSPDQWASRVLLVTGPAGMGKTTVFRRLSANLEPQVKATRINAALIHTARDLLEGVNQGFGVANPADGRLGAVKSLVVDFVQRQVAAGRSCVVLVDDAHLLEPQATELLIDVVSEADLHVVFFAEPEFVEPIFAAVRRGAPDVEPQQIVLGPLSAGEQREYLEWRLSAAEYRGHLPFTEDQLQRIDKQSAGVPGRVNEVAHSILVELETGAHRRNRGFPRAHLMAAVAIALLVVIAYLIWDESAMPTPSPMPTVDQRAEPLEPSTVVGQVQRDDRDDGIGGGRETAMDSTQPIADAPEPVATSPATAIAEVPDLPPKPEPEPEPVPAPVVANDVRDAAWLLAQSADSFTVQLLATVSEPALIEYLDRQKQKGRFAVYQRVRDGTVLSVVVYGVYSTRAEADRAAKSLPAEVGKVSPWIRPLSAVHSAIRTTLQTR